MKGTDVYNGNGEHLGHIDDIVLGKRDGHAEYAIMSFGGFLGMGEQYHPLPWQSLTYDPKLRRLRRQPVARAARRRPEPTSWPTSPTGTTRTPAAASATTTATR